MWTNCLACVSLINVCFHVYFLLWRTAFRYCCWSVCLLVFSLYLDKLVTCVYLVWLWSGLFVYVCMPHDTALWVDVWSPNLPCVYIWQAEDDVGRTPTLTHSCPYMMSCTEILSLFDDAGAAVSFYDEGGRQVQWLQTKTRAPEGGSWLYATLIHCLEHPDCDHLLFWDTQFKTVQKHSI